jgi:steroid delta-isomerase-like uncharacterized protein
MTPVQSQPTSDEPQSLDVIREYVRALKAKDGEGMQALRAPGFVMDYVYSDAFGRSPLSADETEAFWPAWFAGFPEMDFELTRTIAAESVVVVQWTFTGTHTGVLEPAAFGRRVEPTGGTIQLRGISVYDIAEGLIQRETMYLDFATLWVELGIELEVEP